MAASPPARSGWTRRIKTVSAQLSPQDRSPDFRHLLSRPARARSTWCFIHASAVAVVQRCGPDLFSHGGSAVRVSALSLNRWIDRRSRVGPGVEVPSVVGESELFRSRSDRPAEGTGSETT